MIGIPWPIHLLLLLGMPIVGAQTARRLHRGGITLANALRRVPWLWAVLPLLGLLLVTHFGLQARPDLWWLLPPWLEVSYLALIWGGILMIFGLIFGLVITLAYLESHPERRKAVFAAVLCVAAVEVAHARHTRLIGPDLVAHETADGIVLQTTGVSCAAASLANWRRLEGHPATEREMADLMGTTTLGTTAGQVIRGLEQIGRVCQKAELSPEVLVGPAMLFVDHPDIGPDAHAVLHVAGKDGHHEVWDPAVGRRRLDTAGLRAIWRGRAITCL